MLQASVTLPAGDLDEPDDGRVLVWSDLPWGTGWASGPSGDHSTASRRWTRSCSGLGAGRSARTTRWWSWVTSPCRSLRASGSSRWRKLPGWKVLVFGNHDQNGRGGVVTDPFDEAHLALAAAGDPPLVLTHLPLEEVPEGAVNLHGRIHRHRLPGRRINVSVEQLEYRPWPLTALRRLAGRLVRRPTLYPAELRARPLESITYGTAENSASRFCQPNRVRDRRWRPIRALRTCDRHVVLLQLRRGVDHRRLGGRTSPAASNSSPTRGWRAAAPIPTDATRNGVGSSRQASSGCRPTICAGRMPASA